MQPLFVTVDPERDDPAALRDYMAHFGPRFLGLRGTPAQTRAVLKAWRIHRRKVPAGAGADADDYLVDHATLTFLMGPDGRFRTLFPHDTRAEKMTPRSAAISPPNGSAVPDTVAPAGTERRSGAGSPSTAASVAGGPGSGSGATLTRLRYYVPTSVSGPASPKSVIIL